MQFLRQSGCINQNVWVKLGAEELCSGVVNEFSLGSYLVTFVHDLIVCDYVNVACA